MKIGIYIDAPGVKTKEEGLKLAAQLAEEIVNSTANNTYVIKTIHSQLMVQRKES